MRAPNPSQLEALAYRLARQYWHADKETQAAFLRAIDLGWADLSSDGSKCLPRAKSVFDQNN